VFLILRVEKLRVAQKIKSAKTESGLSNPFPLLFFWRWRRIKKKQVPVFCWNVLSLSRLAGAREFRGGGAPKSPYMRPQARRQNLYS